MNFGFLKETMSRESNLIVQLVHHSFSKQLPAILKWFQRSVATSFSRVNVAISFAVFLSQHGGGSFVWFRFFLGACVFVCGTGSAGGGRIDAGTLQNQPAGHGRVSMHRLQRRAAGRQQTHPRQRRLWVIRYAHCSDVRRPFQQPLQESFPFLLLLGPFFVLHLVVWQSNQLRKAQEWTTYRNFYHWLWCKICSRRNDEIRTGTDNRRFKPMLIVIRTLSNVMIRSVGHCACLAFSFFFWRLCFLSGPPPFLSVRFVYLVWVWFLFLFCPAPPPPRQAA